MNVGREWLASRIERVSTLRRNLIVALALILAAGAALFAALVLTGDEGEEGAAKSPASTHEVDERLVRDDSPRLSEGKDAVFVEFLDFECEGCLAAYPVIEDMRERYGDRVTFVVRHLPLHSNSMNAALAAEAAAQQGEFEAMYSKLFETAQDWGHQETSQKDVFFGFAKEMGLDMTQFKADFDATETRKRIEQSQADGKALGVEGTPTFFLNGKRFEPQSAADFETAFDDVLN